MDARLKELFNAELTAIGQEPIDAGDEWTEMIERVFEIRVREEREAMKRVIEAARNLKSTWGPSWHTFNAAVAQYEAARGEGR